VPLAKDRLCKKRHRLPIARPVKFTYLVAPQPTSSVSFFAARGLLLSLQLRRNEKMEAAMVDPALSVSCRNSVCQLLLLGAVSGLLGGCAQSEVTPASTTPVAAPVVAFPAATPSPVPKPKSIAAVASWYGPGLEGRKTASGEMFHQQELTAASSIMPLGSRAKVINPANGRAVAVRINDCGPFAAGRQIDLSRRAAVRLGIIRTGVKPVRVQVLRRGTSGRVCEAHHDEETQQ
jgi:peptidoglycan lytic transglycosylase